MGRGERLGRQRLGLSQKHGKQARLKLGPYPNLFAKAKLFDVKINWKFLHSACREADNICELIWFRLESNGRAVEMIYRQTRVCL